MRFHITCTKQTLNDKHLSVTFTYAAKGFPQMIDMVPKILQHNFKTFNNIDVPLCIKALKL